MAKYLDAKVIIYWLDEEMKEYFTILETIDGQLRLIVTPRG